MRKRFVIKNVTMSFVSYIMIFIMGLVVRKQFLITLGEEYLGLNSLFLNILSILSIAELGIESSIIFALYEPIENKNWELINKLINFYKHCYRKVAFTIFFCGLLTLPFLKYIIGVNNSLIDGHIHGYFLLALLDVTISYFLSYKRCLFLADQKNYKIVIVHTICVIVSYSFKIYMLSFKSYVCFLIVGIIFNFMENLIISIWTNRSYHELKSTDTPLEDEVKESLFLKIRGLLAHRIGGAIVNGTDNIIISSLINVATVGLYANYSTIISALSALVSSMGAGITSSIGNLLVSSDDNHIREIFFDLVYVYIFLFTIISSVVLNIISPFITIWFGENFVLEQDVVLIVILVFWLTGIRKMPEMFNGAAGIFYENRFIPIVECIINLVSSLILVRFLGLKGVFCGTIFGSIFALLSNIYFVLKYPLRNLEVSIFLKKIFPKFLRATIVICISYFVSCYTIDYNLIAGTAIKVILIMTFSIIVFVITDLKSCEVQYCINLLFGKIRS